MPSRLLVTLLSLPAICTMAAAQSPAQREIATEAANAFDAGKWSMAAGHYRRLTEIDASNGKAWFRLGYALHATGKTAEALEAHGRAAEFADFRPTASYNAACAAALLGRKDEAFAWLDKALGAGFRDGNQLRIDTDLKGLRGDARFATLLAKVQPTKMHSYDAALNKPRPSNQTFAALPHAQAFHFMANKWQIRNVFINPQGQRATTAGSNDGGQHLGGKVVIDHYAGTLYNGKKLKGMTIRAYDKVSDTWSIVWLDDNQSPNFAPMIGRFEGGIGTFYPKGTTAETATTRFHWDGISDDGARWMQQSRVQTTKDGERWVASWVMEFSR